MRADYPLNLLRDIPVGQILSDDQMKGLEYALKQLTEWEQIVRRALRKLSRPALTAYIREGFTAHEESVLDNVRMAVEKKRNTGGGGKFINTGNCRCRVFGLPALYNR